MALTWNWDNKVGEAIFARKMHSGETKEFTTNLYEGNAYLVFIYEWKEDDTEKYNLQGFFLDKAHMKRCLGIDKRSKDTYGHNTYATDGNPLVKIRFNKAKSSNYKEIIPAFIEAFDNIDIEVYTEE